VEKNLQNTIANVVCESSSDNAYTNDLLREAVIPDGLVFEGDDGVPDLGLLDPANVNFAGLDAVAACAPKQIAEEQRSLLAIGAARLRRPSVTRWHLDLPADYAWRPRTNVDSSSERNARRQKHNRDLKARAAGRAVRAYAWRDLMTDEELADHKKRQEREKKARYRAKKAASPSSK